MPAYEHVWQHALACTKHFNVDCFIHYILFVYDSEVYDSEVVLVRYRRRARFCQKLLGMPRVRLGTHLGEAWKFRGPATAIHYKSTYRCDVTLCDKLDV
jgi:hypothetical protein